MVLICIFLFSRPGLSARQPLFGSSDGNTNRSDQVEISINGGLAYDIDAEIEELHHGIGRLKQVSSSIHEGNQLTGQIMESLETAMDTAKASLRQTMKRLDEVARKTKSNHLLYVILFGLVILLGVYFWTKISKLFHYFFV